MKPASDSIMRSDLGMHQIKATWDWNVQRLDGKLAAYATQKLLLPRWLTIDKLTYLPRAMMICTFRIHAQWGMRSWEQVRPSCDKYSRSHCTMEDSEETQHATGFLPSWIRWRDPLQTKILASGSSWKTLINHKPYRTEQVGFVIRPLQPLAHEDHPA